MVMASFVDDLRDLTVHLGSLDLLLHRTIRSRTLVVAPRVFAPFHLLLSVLSPIVTVLRFLLSHVLIARLRLMREFMAVVLQFHYVAVLALFAVEIPFLLLLLFL